MSITAISQSSSGGVVTVRVTSSLTGGAAPVYYFWYVDGAYVGMTTGASRTFVSDAGAGQAVVDVLDSNDPAFDAIANNPAAFPARRSLVFVRSVDPNVARYRIEQQENGGAWSTIGFLRHEPSRWQYTFLSPRLDDLADYAWRVVPLDAAGNAGTAAAIAQERIVRTPDAPDFTATLQGSTRVAFASA